MPELELYPYQQKALYASVLNHHLMNFDCGLGKTVTAIELGEAFLKQNMIAMTSHSHKGRVLVTAPKRLVLQWAKVIHEQTGRGVTVIPSGIMYDPKKLEGWVITHYEVMNSKTGRPLRSVMWDVHIVDEAHYMCNRKAARTRAVKAIDSFRRIALTATPLDKAPDELWSILNWFEPRKWTSYWNFVQKYCDIEEVPPWLVKGRSAVMSVVGAKEANLPLLAEEMKPYFTRVLKEEAAPWLPELTVQKVPVEMSIRQQRVYLDVVRADDIIVESDNIELYVPNVLSRIVKLQQITSGAIQGVPSEKVRWAIDYRNDNPNEVMMFFTRFVLTGKALADRFGCEFVTAGSELPKDFIEGRSNTVVGTIDAMGEGIDGLQRAKTAVFVDQHWSSRKMTQAVSRVHRLGIKEGKNVVYLYCPKTYDEMVLKSIEEKWTTQELVYSYLKGEPNDNTGDTG